MHLSDALISPPVAMGAAVVAAGLIALASKKVKNDSDSEKIPLMGILGAFVFAAQMINFTIPGTGSSGHLIGGILLSALLGPWAAFITLSSILIVQCLFFADGGLFALGCNIINMAALSCLVAYPLIYKPIAGKSLNPVRLSLACVLASIIGLEAGAFAVTLETELSGITVLPFSSFLKFMLPIHLAIGFVEGIVTASLIIFIAKYRPNLLEGNTELTNQTFSNYKPVLIIFGILTLVLAGGFTFLASNYPDGLEWSVEKVSGLSDFPTENPATAFMPDYNSGFAGIVGSVIVMVALWGITNIIFSKFKKSVKKP